MKRKAVAMLLSLGVISATLFGTNVYAAITIPQETEQQAEDGVQEEAVEEPAEEASEGQYLTSTNETAEEYSVQEVAAHALPSVVLITTKSIQEVQDWFSNRVYSDEITGGGSGIICKMSDTELLVLTNSHVVEDTSEVTLTFNDEETYEGKVKGYDSNADVAIVSVPLEELSEETLASITVADFGVSDDLNLGEQVVAIGNALGYGQSVTVGYVSALNRTLNGVDFGLIQTDAAINSGNSGGALLNMKGEVIGINSYKYASEGVEGMGYAIPITTVDDIIRDLAERETRTELVSDDEASKLGIIGNTVSEEVQYYYNIPSGVYISEVSEDSAAEKAGMKKGQVLTKFDGITISDMNGLKNLMRYYKAGETIEVVVMEAQEGEYQEKTLTVTLDKADVVPEEENSSQANEGEDQYQDDYNDYFSNPFSFFGGRSGSGSGNGNGNSSPFRW